MKTVFLPAQPFYRIGEAEGVYAARAAKGLILKKSGRYLDRYEKAEPQTLHYRLEFFKGDGPDEEQLELYEGAGWKLVSYCAYNGRAVFVSASPLAEELYSDPDSALAMLRRLRRVRLTDGIWVALFAVFEVWQLAGFGRSRGLYQMLAVSDSLIVMAALVAALLVCKGCYGIVRLSMLIHRLKRGEPIDHNARLSVVERVQRVLTLALYAALVVSVGALFVESYQASREHPLPEPSAGQVWFEAADLFENSHRMTAEESEHFYRSAENTIQYGGTWLYPEVYEIESFATCGPTADGRSLVICMLDVDCYRARNAELAEKLARDIMEHSIWLRDDEEAVLYEDDRFDLILGAQYDRAIVRGTRVYVVTCIESGGYWDSIYDLIMIK